MCLSLLCLLCLTDRRTLRVFTQAFGAAIVRTLPSEWPVAVLTVPSVVSAIECDFAETAVPDHDHLVGIEVGIAFWAVHQVVA